jgi:hypothetical protein
LGREQQGDGAVAVVGAGAKHVFDVQENGVGPGGDRDGRETVSGKLVMVGPLVS